MAMLKSPFSEALLWNGKGGKTVSRVILLYLPFESSASLIIPISVYKIIIYVANINWAFPVF